MTEERGRTTLDGGLDAPVLTGAEVTQALARIIDRLSVLERESALLQVDVQRLLERVQGRNGLRAAAEKRLSLHRK